MLSKQATESECRHLIENELMRSIDAIDNEHKSRINDLEIQLSQSEARIADIETKAQRSRHSSQQDGAQECLRRQLGQSQTEVSSLQSKLRAAESQLQAHNHVCVSRCAVAASAPEINKLLLTF